MLNERQERIIKLLNESQEWKTGKDISKFMEVSDRTIRSDIDAINRFYGKTVIESSIKNGYHINSEIISSLPKQLTCCIPQTPKERCNYIIRELLTNKKEINLLNLQNEVFISGYTIDNDLKKVKRIIGDYKDLKIIRSKNFISLKGPEKSKRELYKDLLSEETKGNFLNLDNIAFLFKDFDLKTIKGILDEILVKYDYHIRETAMPMVLMHIGVSIERMMHQNYVNQIAENNVNLMDSLEFRIANEFYLKCANRIFIQPQISEIQLLSLLLMGKKSEEFTSNQIEIHSNVYLISDIVHNILQKLYEAYDIDLRRDNDLIYGLGLHIRSLVHRILYGSTIQNVYLEEIKRKYPLVFDMSIYACRCFTEITGLEIQENEIGFMALHLGSSYEKNNFCDKYQTLMIFPRDLPLSNLCVQKIEKRFSERMEIMDHVNFFNEEEVLYLKPDLILTTTSLKHNLDIPTIQISLFVDTEDESHIFQALNLLDKKKNKKQFETMIKDVIKPELFFIDITAENEEELIRMVCKELVKNGYVDDTFVDSVLQREKISSTSFYNGFALPHAINHSAIESCISIVLLKEAMQWHDYSVRLVILLAIEDVDRDLLRIFFDWLSSIVSDSNKLNDLLNVKTHKEFINQIMKG
ncbi:MAG: BglG family transcription antiterminator [Floccifex porci]|uniref:BglG family transcription antiterminator n=1 Tax=Floccifex porci TaxID=2606629 RepID=UPI003F0D8A56